MTAPRPEPWNDDWIEQMAAFDEALRLGRTPELTAPVDPQMLETQQFLLKLQSVWPRPSRTIGPYTLIHSLGQGAVGPCYLVETPASLPTPHRGRGTGSEGGDAPVLPSPHRGKGVGGEGVEVPKNGERLVVKVLWPELSADAETRRQFIADASLAQSPTDANILAVRAIHDQATLCVVASTYCPGASLAEWRRKKPQPLPWQVASSLILRIADILAPAHQRGIGHGNLKPSNIFLPDGDELSSARIHEAALQIGDFGLAKAVQQTRVTNQGGLPWPLPQYLAPEQLYERTQPVKPASDVYALGVLWYDLLTGRCPVRGTTRAEVLEHVRAATATPPRHYRPEIPAAVEALVLQCLHRNARSRPESAARLAEAVRALLPSAPVTAPPWWKHWLGWK